MSAIPIPGQASTLASATAFQDQKEEKDRDKQFKTLIAALKRHTEQLPDDVQLLMKEVSARTGQEETKLLHSAVTQHGKAKKEVEEAQIARFNMHQAWRNFLAASVQQWQKYSTQFMEQEKTLTDRLQVALENLASAKSNLTSCKASAGLEVKDDATMPSDMEDPEPKSFETSAGKRIAEGFKDLSTNLQALHSQAEQAVQLEAEQQDHIKKRPRTGSPDTANADSAMEGSHLHKAE